MKLVLTLQAELHRYLRHAYRVFLALTSLHKHAQVHQPKYCTCRPSLEICLSNSLHQVGLSGVDRFAQNVTGRQGTSSTRILRMRSLSRLREMRYRGFLKSAMSNQRRITFYECFCACQEMSQSSQSDRLIGSRVIAVCLTDTRKHIRSFTAGKG